MAARVFNRFLAIELREEPGAQAEQGKKGADVEDRIDARPVGKASQNRGADAPQPERQTEEQAGNRWKRFRGPLAG
jgi:hypothetical protein